MTPKEAKQLAKAYTKAFNKLQKDVFTYKKSGLVLFIEYLRYLRDSIILTDYGSDSENTKLRIATIIAAIAEFNTYEQKCNEEQKVFHWDNFCELLRLNMEDWLKINDSI
jgi:hypothetical protein